MNPNLALALRLDELEKNRAANSPSLAVVFRGCQLIPHASLGYSTGEERRVKWPLAAFIDFVRIGAYLIGCCRIQRQELYCARSRSAARVRKVPTKATLQARAPSTKHMCMIRDCMSSRAHDPMPSDAGLPVGYIVPAYMPPYPPAPSPGTTPTANITRATTQRHHIREPLQRRRTRGNGGERSD